MGESFVGENDVRFAFVSFDRKISFWFRLLYEILTQSVSFSFLNTVKWFRQEIYAYGDLLQNERHVLKHVSSLHNEKSRFLSVFQVYKMKQHVFT